MHKDYYEILELEPTCSQDEIKQAYRKMALKYHPDKNPSEDAKIRFQGFILLGQFKEINQANEILSDPNERTWYDAHKNQILRETMNTEDYETKEAYGFNIWHYFQTDYVGYEDDPKGYYAFYRQAFELIKISEEKAFNTKQQQESSSDEEAQAEYEKLPGFGTSKSDTSQVLHFYSKWENFTSYKTFAWADKYNPNEAPNRYIKRQIQKENKKDRIVEKKKYIKTIKKLVETVKNRDPRYKMYLEQIKREEDIAKQKKKIQLQEQKDLKEALQQERREAELQRFKENEEYFRNKNEEIIIEPVKQQNHEAFYCEVCDKEFKSESQLKNHNNSKQHKINLKDLISQVTQDKKEQENLLRQAGLGAKVEVNITEKELEEKIKFQVEQEEKKLREKKEQERLKKLKKNQKKKQKKKGTQQQKESSESENEEQQKNEEQTQVQEEKQLQSESEEEDQMVKQIQNKIQQMKYQKQQKEDYQQFEEKKEEQLQKEQDKEDLSSNDEDPILNQMKNQLQKKKPQAKQNIDFQQKEQDQNKQQQQQINQEVTEQENQIPKNQKTQQKKQQQKKTQKQDEVPKEQITPKEQETKKSTSKFLSNQSDEDEDHIDETKLNKAKLKKLKRKQKEEEEKNNKFKCNICKSIFESKSKLFKHLQDEGHQSAK